MFLNIATTVTLIAACMGHEQAYEERASDEAISTQSFNRDDIPISYKYTSIHVYSTQKPIDEDDVIRPQKHQKPDYPVIQYAPLIDSTTKNTTYSTKVLDSDDVKKVNTEIKNDKLEPRKHPSRLGDASKFKYFVPGHNIEVKRSPNRNLVHNDVYQNEPENLASLYNEIKNTLRETVKHQDPRIGHENHQYYSKHDATKPQRTFNYRRQEPFSWVFEKREKPNTYMVYKAEPNVQTNKLNPSTTHHTHRMQINVARMNGHAQVISREIVIGDTLKNLGTPQRYPYLKGGIRLHGEQRTLLYPKKPQPYQRPI